MKIIQNLVSPSKYNIKCPYIMNPEFIVVHNTANDASAKNEVAYMIGNNNQVSFHYAIDDKEIVQGIPEPTEPEPNEMDLLKDEITELKQIIDIMLGGEVIE